MANIYLARHGETELNKARVYYGKLDPSLSSEGIGQCNKLRMKMDTIAFDHVISSTRKRALETACILGDVEESSVIRLSDLDEVDFGEWEGHDYLYISAHYPAEYRSWAMDWKDFTFPGGESFGKLRDRVARAIEHIMEKYRDKTLLIVAHEGSLKLLMILLMELDEEAFWRIAVDIGKYSVLDIRSHFGVLQGLNLG